MPQIHSPELATAIRQHYGVRGQQGFDTIAPEIIPVTIVDEIERQVGFECGGATSGAGAAGEKPFVSLSAGAVDQVLFVRGVWVALGSIQTVRVIMSTATSVTIVAGEKHFLDRRYRGDPSGIIGFGSVVGVPVGDNIFRGPINNTNPLWIPLGVTLSPVGGLPEAGSSRILVSGDTDASVIFASFFWRESAARPGDRVS